MYQFKNTMIKKHLVQNSKKNRTYLKYYQEVWPELSKLQNFDEERKDVNKSRENRYFDDKIKCKNASSF